MNKGSDTRERRALFAGLAAVTLWSTVATGFKLGLEVLAVEQLLFVGTLVSWLVFGLYALWTQSYRVPRATMPIVALLGLINPCAYYLVLFEAYDRLPAHIAQPLNYTWAITLALLAVPLLKQRLTARMIVGIFCAYGGVLILLVPHGGVDANGLDGLGVALALASTLLWAIYWLINTRIAAEVSPHAVMLWSFTVAVPVIGLVCVLGAGLPTFDQPTLLYGTWVGAIEMGVTFLLWQHALHTTSHVARIGTLIFLSPFLSLLMIYYVLGERIGIHALLALVVITLGVMLTRSSTSQPSR